MLINVTQKLSTVSPIFDQLCIYLSFKFLPFSFKMVPQVLEVPQKLKDKVDIILIIILSKLVYFIELSAAKNKYSWFCGIWKTCLKIKIVHVHRIIRMLILW